MRIVFSGLVLILGFVLVYSFSNEKTKNIIDYSPFSKTELELKNRMINDGYNQQNFIEVIKNARQQIKKERLK